MKKTYYSMTRRFIVTYQGGGSNKYGPCEISGIHSDNIVSVDESIKNHEGGYSHHKTTFMDIDQFVGYINNKKQVIQPEEIKSHGLGIT